MSVINIVGAVVYFPTTLIALFCYVLAGIYMFDKDFIGAVLPVWLPQEVLGMIDAPEPSAKRNKRFNTSLEVVKWATIMSIVGFFFMSI